VLSLPHGASGVLFDASAGGADRLRRGTELAVADAVEKYLPALRAWETRAASLGRPPRHRQTMARIVATSGFCCSGRFEKATTARRKTATGLVIDGKRLGVRPRADVLVFQPSRSSSPQTTRRPVLFTRAATLHTDVDLYWAGRRHATEVDVKRMIWGWDETTKQDKRSPRTIRPASIEALSARPLFGARAPRGDVFSSGTWRNSVTRWRAPLRGVTPKPVHATVSVMSGLDLESIGRSVVKLRADVPKMRLRPVSGFAAHRQTASSSIRTG